jgi:putative ABC transport system permease protein
LSSIGAALGLIVAQFGSRLLLAQVSGNLKLDTGVNFPILAFAIALAILTGLLFGMAPAIRSTSAVELRTASTAGHSRGRLGGLLVTMQVALSLLLLIGAGLFTRTLHNLQMVDPGFRHEDVLMVDVDARRAFHAGPEANARVAAVFRDGLQTLTSVPGVSAVAVSNFTPISGGYWSQPVSVNGKSASEGDVIFFAVSPGFFTALSMRLKAGRDFSIRDDGSALPVAIANEEFVRRFMPGGRNPLGQEVSAADSRFWKNMQVVGVVGNSRPYSLREPVRPCLYVPFFQQPPDQIGFGTFEVKASGSRSVVAANLQQTLSRQFPSVPLQIRPFTVQIENSIRGSIVLAQLTRFFGLIALLLAAVGLYGLLAYAVAQRTSEIGIRMALGAKPAAVVRMMVGRAARLVVAGILIALPVAWWASRLVAALLYGIEPFDPGTVAAAVAILILVALAAGFIPARRAAKVDPMAALRQD